MSARVGILGGTFDPPHIGHLVAADDAAAALDLGEVWFIPAGAHPLKGVDVVAPAELRWTMVQAAIRGNPRFRALDLELRRSGPSYSVETLHELRESHPDAALHFLVGVDAARELHKWREPETIARIAALVVLSRGGEAPDDVPLGVPVPHETVHVTRVDVSSTEIRRRIRERRPFRYLVPEDVYRILSEHEPYG